MLPLTRHFAYGHNEVNISESGSAILFASFLNKRAGNPSGPVPPPSFNFLIAACTKLGVKITVSMLSVD